MDMKNKYIKSLLGLPMYGTVGIILFNVIDGVFSGEISLKDISGYFICIIVLFVIQLIINNYKRN